MSDQQPSQPSRNTLGEISYLFLSSVREKAGNGGARPQRTPPPKIAHTIDLSPEEFARAVDGEEPSDSDRGRATIPEVTAVIGSHLNGKQFDRAKEYARHLAGSGMRVGLIECD